MPAYVFDHLHLRSPDPDAAARFYVEVMGAEMRGRDEGTTPSGADSLRVTVAFGGVPVFIDRVPAGTAGPPKAPFLGLEHFGLRVEGIDAVAAELKSRGAEFEVEPYEIRPGLRIAFVRAPDGVRVELLQRG